MSTTEKETLEALQLIAKDMGYDCITDALTDTNKMRSQYSAYLENLKSTEKENNYLRGLIPKTIGKCIYCGLEDMGKCKSGFPGCAWADDIMIAQDDTMQRIMAQRDGYRKAIELTLAENLHLADGEICTLIRLKKAINLKE